MRERTANLTLAILDDRGLHSNGSPHWTVGRDKRPNETFEAADERRLEVVVWLSRHGTDHPEALALSERLADCSPHTPCRSPACSCCDRAHTRWFVESAANAFRSFSGDVNVLSIVDARHAALLGKLSPEVLQQTGAGVSGMLKDLGVTTSITTVDISANESDNGEFLPHWQSQGWVFAPAAQVRPVAREIRAAFPATDTVPRPVRIQTWDGDLAALAYGFKAESVRRVSTTKPPSSDAGRGACRDTRDRPLRVDQIIGLIEPRGLTREDAAAYVGLSPEGFDQWVRRGLVPGPIPGTQRWDRKAIDLALDRASGLDTMTSSAFDTWKARHAG